MDQYQITLKGLTPILMHNDNLAFAEKIAAWQRSPENKGLSVAGDDRSPPWTWIGYLYHDGKHIGINADNIMTMLREGGAQVRTGKKQETYKKHTQSGLMLDEQQLALYVGNGDGKQINMDDIRTLIGQTDFNEHLEVAERLGFELSVKRARIGRSKHVRVRPMFRNWIAIGTLTIFDAEISGLTKEILTMILQQAGALCGLCDWRPSSNKSGVFGKFDAIVEKI